MTYEELVKEAVTNARKDRLALEKVRDNLTNTTPEQDEVLDETPLAQLGIAENVARIHDVLVKVNGQLVEMAKVAAKMENPQSASSFTDRDDIYDEISKKEN